MLSPEQRQSWDDQGFFLVPGFAGPDVLDAMTATVTELARRCDEGGDIRPAFVQPEARLAHLEVPAEQRLSKLFRVHREHEAFHGFCCDPRLTDLVAPLLGEELDCFLSQFIFKHPGAMGQPWHQDAFYFRFDRGPQVGVWLAVTEATLENGPLWVLPGSHQEAVAEVVPDRRPGANLGYVEIEAHDFDGAVPVLMQPGDLLVFHSHLMHRSTDNGSDGSRAAMVFHYAEAGTVDQSLERMGFVPPNVDWMPARRKAA